MTEIYSSLVHGIYYLTEENSSAIKSYLEKETFNPFNGVEDFEQFVSISFGVLKILPNEILKAMLNFRVHGNKDGACLIRGLSIDDSKLGPTPINAKSLPNTKISFETELYLVGCASAFGEVFAFSSQYGGQIIQNVFPLKEDAAEQKGTGSVVFLDWHTEDASFDERADIIALLCLRSNPEAATTIASVSNMELTVEEKRILFEPRFWVAADQVHDELDKKDRLVSVLFGAFDDPYIRLDPLYMRGADHDAQKALEYIIGKISGVARQIILQKGDLIFIDNYRAVHGRTKFTPKYDGADRWLQRVSITFDLRKSRHLRLKKFRTIDYGK